MLQRIVIIYAAVGVIAGVVLMFASANDGAGAIPVVTIPITTPTPFNSEDYQTSVTTARTRVATVEALRMAPYNTGALDYRELPTQVGYLGDAHLHRMTFEELMADAVAVVVGRVEKVEFRGYAGWVTISPIQELAGLQVDSPLQLPLGGSIYTGEEGDIYSTLEYQERVVPGQSYLVVLYGSSGKQQWYAHPQGGLLVEYGRIADTAAARSFGLEGMSLFAAVELMRAAMPNP